MTQALVIDDNRLAADILCMMLKSLGLEAKAVYGPHPALVSALNIKPDVVFVDINMPGVDGFEVMAFFQREPRLENTPVVFVTGDDQQDTANRVRAQGAAGLLLKPVNLEALQDVLHQLKLA